MNVYRNDGHVHLVLESTNELDRQWNERLPGWQASAAHPSFTARGLCSSLIRSGDPCHRVSTRTVDLQCVKSNTGR